MQFKRINVKDILENAVYCITKSPLYACNVIVLGCKSPNAANHKFNNILSINENGYHQQQLLVLALLKFHGTLMLVVLNSTELWY
jgi:hypothetical protein